MVDGHREHMQQVGRRFPTATAVAGWITRETSMTLITEHGYAGEVDLFSLDLDGNDYWIWEAVTRLVTARADHGIQLDVRSRSRGHDSLRPHSIAIVIIRCTTAHRCRR